MPTWNDMSHRPVRIPTLVLHIYLSPLVVGDSKMHRLSYLWPVGEYNWAYTWQNQQKDLCAQQRLRSAWAFAQSDQRLCCTHEKSVALSYPVSAQWRLWWDWVDAQADLSLRWAHRSFCWFCQAVTQLNLSHGFHFCSWHLWPARYKN